MHVLDIHLLYLPGSQEPGWQHAHFSAIRSLPHPASTSLHVLANVSSHRGLQLIAVDDEGGNSYSRMTICTAYYKYSVTIVRGRANEGVSPRGAQYSTLSSSSTKSSLTEPEARILVLSN